MVVSSEVSGHLITYPENSIDPSDEVGALSIVAHCFKSHFSLVLPFCCDKLSDKISGNVYVPVYMQHLACSATAACQSKGTSIN